MAPLPFNPFAKKGQHGQGGGKEGSPSGGGLPPVELPPPPKEIEGKALEEELTPLQIAQNEIDGLFSPYMDDLVLQQDPEAPWLIQFGLKKGETFIKTGSKMETDSRVLVLISPDDRNQFTLITRWGPKRIEPQGRITTENIKNIIDHILKYGKDDLLGGFYPNRQEGDPEIIIGYNPNQQQQGNTQHVQVGFTKNELLEPSPQEVLDRIKASKELALAGKGGKQKPLRDAQEELRRRQEILDALSRPESPPGLTETPLPPSSTG